MGAAEHAERSRQLAPAFAAVPGLISKTWLENRTSGSYGGFYVFETKAAFDRFVASELFELTYAQAHVADLATCEFSVDQGPTSVTRGPRESRRRSGARTSVATEPEEANQSR